MTSDLSEDSEDAEPKTVNFSKTTLKATSIIKSKGRKEKKEKKKKRAKYNREGFVPFLIIPKFFWRQFLLESQFYFKNRTVIWCRLGAIRFCRKLCIDTKFISFRSTLCNELFRCSKMWKAKLPIWSIVQFYDDFCFLWRLSIVSILINVIKSKAKNQDLEPISQSKLTS